MKLLSAYRPSFYLPFEHGLPYDYLDGLYHNYWHWTVALSLFYVVVIFSIQRWMRDRKPLVLSRQFFWWNTALALFSVVGTIRTTGDFFHAVGTNGFYESVCFEPEMSSIVVHWYILFSLSKIVELGDTIFLVLKKKPLTFLHWYHHCTVLVYTFNAGAEHLPAGRWFMWMNLLAHSVMYTYYAAMSAGFRVPRGVAKCVTLVQITQMFVALAVSGSVFVIKHILGWPCMQSTTNFIITWLIYASYAFLFIQFFVRTYMKTKKE